MRELLLCNALAPRRPPHGGRGLKCNQWYYPTLEALVALPTEGVD